MLGHSQLPGVATSNHSRRRFSGVDSDRAMELSSGVECGTLSITGLPGRCSPYPDWTHSRNLVQDDHDLLLSIRHKVGSFRLIMRTAWRWKNRWRLGYQGRFQAGGGTIPQTVLRANTVAFATPKVQDITDGIMDTAMSRYALLEPAEPSSSAA